MARIARESRDPRTYNQPLPDVPAKEHREAKVRMHKLGYQDATQVTAEMSQDKAGQRALTELLKGNTKPYRRLAERRYPLS